jgi:hypothetical protein
MKCIFCLTEAPGSVEHVFPESIGGGFTIDRLCKCCNECFGQNIDPLIIRHPLANMYRAAERVHDKRGNVPTNVFAEGTMEHEVRAGETRPVRVKTNVDPKTGLFVVEVLPTFWSDIGEDGGAKNSAIFGMEKESDARAWFRKGLERQRIPISDDAHFEELWKASHEIRNVPTPTAQHSLPLMDEFKYRHALLKIVFEMAWYWIGDPWLTDPVARVMRRVLRSEPRAQLPIHGTMTLGNDPPFITQLTTDIKLGAYEHVAMLIVAHGRAAVMVSVFNAFSGVVEVTTSAHKFGLVGLAPSLIKVLLLDSRDHSFNETTLAALLAERQGAL